MKDLILHNGQPRPLGGYQTDRGFAFAVAASDAKRVSLCLFALDSSGEQLEVLLDPLQHRTDDTWHVEVEGLLQPFAYGYRVDQEPFVLLDPYAKGIYAPRHGEVTDIPYFYSPLGLVPTALFDWEEISPPKLRLEELIIYEMHLRGFTQHSSSDVAKPGTFLGMIDKIPHLLKLGVNAVEFLPIFEFDETECDRCSIIGGQRLGNYWGYSTVNFFSPMVPYGTTESLEAPITELKTLIRELHRAGIAVILDVVFNHTAEGNHLGPIYSFKKLANDRYYIMNPDGTYQNHSGCGNTFSCNEVLGRNLILDALRYWVREFHVDGFRFDLASILTRDAHGAPVPQPQLLKEISDDPLLSSVKLIAEPWDMGLYQVGSFYTMSEGRWTEWNGRYRDTVRRFLAGHGNTCGEFATRLCGSQDLYWQGSPLNSLNFVTAHDGFTLADLVSYNNKHNQANGEGNRDGLNENLSWNCGVEGPSQDVTILQRRERQMRNFLLALMLSQGVPMLSMGDEYAHTRHGNNNPWSWDDEINWFRWDQLSLPDSQQLMQFISDLIAFRRANPLLTRRRFLTDNDVLWHGLQPLQPNWGPDNRFIAFTLKGSQDHPPDLYVAFNSSQDDVEVTLPDIQGGKWEWIFDTSGRKSMSSPSTITMMERSAVVFSNRFMG